MNFDVLRLLKEENGYISGEEIGKKLGISRAAVWKNITKLKAMGYNIESVSNRGYKLAPFSDVLNEYEIKYDNLVYMEETDSTNEECKRRAAAGCDDGLLAVCSRQTAGKGRLGRSWQAEKNAGVYMSLLSKPDIMPFEAPQITLTAGVAVRRILSEMTGLDFYIKWPNDIVINGKKAVGILTEMNAEMQKVNYIVTGIGINVNNTAFPPDIMQKATSLYMETGVSFKRSDIINRLVPELIDCFDTFEKNGFTAFADEYNKYCANTGREVKTVGGKTEIRGIARGVNERGELIISSEGGEAAVLSGEVSVRLCDDRYI